MKSNQLVLLAMVGAMSLTSFLTTPAHADLLEKIPVKATAPAAPKPTAKDAEASLAKQTSEFRARHAAALDLALKGNTKAAVTELNKLVAEPKLSAEEKDRVFLSLGRINYQDGYDDASLEAYEKVRKGSNSWLESLEEKSWAEMRSGNPAKAMGTLKTVLSPLFRDSIHSEPYFAMSLAELRVCDYRSLFKTIESFKKNFRPRIQAWEMSKDADSRAHLAEVSETIQKLNLVEAEAIQHLYLTDGGKRQGGSVPSIDRSSEQLMFPEVGGDEVWTDEDNYQVREKGCPTSQAFSDKSEKKDKAL